MEAPGIFAFIGFDSVGPAELLVLFAVVLIVVGPKNLPAAARKLGAIMASIRRAADEFKRQLMAMDVEDRPSTSASDVGPEPPPPPDEPRPDGYIDIPPETSAGGSHGGAGDSGEPSESPVPDSEFEPPPDVQAANEAGASANAGTEEEKK